MLLISYDISNDKVRTKFSKYLSKFGFRLQYSVFEITNSDTVLKNIDDKRKLYVEKRELNDEEQAALDRTLRTLHERTANLRMAKENCLRTRVTYYVPCMDENHEAYGCRGSYENYCGIVWKVDAVLRHSLLIGDREIELSDISAITIEEES